MEYVFLGLICLAAGIISFLGAFMNWGWFWNNRRAKRVTKLLGKKGAQIFYGVIGASLLLFGLGATIVGLFA